MVTQALNLKTSDPMDDRLSTAQKASPKLSRQMLTRVLIAMMATPVLTILGLWGFMPQVYEGQLEASVYTEGLPISDFYQVPLDERPSFQGGFIVVCNDSEDDWTHLKMQINDYYSSFDIEPIEAGTEKRFLLSKFITRWGTEFSVRNVPLKSVRIYARRPGGDRATFGKEFEKIENK